MAFTFEVQDPDTPTETANAYISVDELKDYCDGRGIDYSAKTDDEIEQAIVRATDYMDGRWTYAGYRYDSDQSTECPRRDVYDSYGYNVDGFPRAFILACCAYTVIDLIDGKTLMPNSQDNTAAGMIIKERKKVDEIEREYQYSENKGFQWPRWPLPDKFMRQSGLITSVRRTLGRG